MMGLSVYMMVATVAVFWIGAAFALGWSLATGQWHGLSEGARTVLDEED